METQGNPVIAPEGAPLVPEKKGDAIDAMLHYGQKQNGKTDLSFLGEHLRPLAQAFLDIVGENYKPLKGDYSFWRKTLNEWYERGFSSARVTAGTRSHVEKHLSIKSPASVTYAILENDPLQPVTHPALQGMTPA